MSVFFPSLLAVLNVPIEVAHIGNMVSPRINKVTKDMESFADFSLFEELIFTDYKDINELIERLDISEENDEPIDGLSKFKIITSYPTLISIFEKGAAFFFEDDIRYYPENDVFIISKPLMLEEFIGIVCETNYFIFEEYIYKLLHKSYDIQKKVDPYAGLSEAAKRLVQKAEQYEKDMPNQDYKDYTLKNIISKLSVVNIGYNLFNIGELTVYQLYDQFSAYLQQKVALLGENIFANHGGDDFDINEWLKNKDNEI